MVQTIPSSVARTRKEGSRNTVRPEIAPLTGCMNTKAMRLPDAWMNLALGEIAGSGNPLPPYAVLMSA